METFALFDDQTAHAISFMPLSVRADEKVDRIQIKSFIEDDSVTSSAMKGIWAAYSILEKTSQPSRAKGFPKYFSIRNATQPLIPASKKYYIVCDLEKGALKRQVTGESAGLAFCLKFVQHVLSQKMKQDKLPTVAATGILDNRLETARIEKVKSINDKTKAALKVLKSGDYFFYPKESESEIDHILKNKLNEQNIKGIPVNSVQEAVYTYVNSVNPTLTKRVQKPSIFKIAVVLFLLAIVSVALVISNAPTLERVENRLGNGEFVRAVQTFNRIKSKTLSKEDQERFRLVAEQMKKPLHAEIKFEYFSSQNDTDNISGKPLSSLSNVTLTMEDSYRFQLKPSNDCYFYIFQFDSRDGVELLFPLAAFATENNLLHAGMSYDIPGGGNTFYLLDGTHQGSVTLYFLATVWRALDIENAYKVYDESQPDEKKNQRDFLIKRINKRINAPSQNVHGVFVRKEYFLQK